MVSSMLEDIILHKLFVAAFVGEPVFQLRVVTHQNLCYSIVHLLYSFVL